MFKNMNELMYLLFSNRNIDEIVQGRLSYLKSEEYRKAVELPIIGENDEMVIFQNGFISNKQVVGFSLENDEEHCTSYLMDDYDIYSEILRKSYNLILETFLIVYVNILN